MVRYSPFLLRPSSENLVIPRGFGRNLVKIQPNVEFPWNGEAAAGVLARSHLLTDASVPAISCS